MSQPDHKKLSFLFAGTCCIYVTKIPLITKLVQLVKVDHLFLHVMSELFHFMILSLSKNKFQDIFKQRNNDVLFAE